MHRARHSARDIPANPYLWLLRRAGLDFRAGQSQFRAWNAARALPDEDTDAHFLQAPHEVPQQSVYAHLVMAADALSGARPGARREILESYVRRLEDLERISSSFSGVQKSYAVQAGREIRVIVEHTKVSDDEAFVLSKDIARKIETEMTYPGQVKVCVIRETRAVDFAR